MKINILILLAAAIITACGNNAEPKKISTDIISISQSADSVVEQQLLEKGGPQFSFEKVEHDFGTITQGEQAEYSFKFTNTGNQDLLIANALASCGCTVPEYSKEPIKPGVQGLIKVKFNSDYRLDGFEKSITIIANTLPGETLLRIKGFINPKPGVNTKSPM